MRRRSQRLAAQDQQSELKRRKVTNNKSTKPERKRKRTNNSKENGVKKPKRAFVVPKVCLSFHFDQARTELDASLKRISGQRKEDAETEVKATVPWLFATLGHVSSAYVCSSEPSDDDIDSLIQQFEDLDLTNANDLNAFYKTVGYHRVVKAAADKISQKELDKILGKVFTLKRDGKHWTAGRSLIENMLKKALPADVVAPKLEAIGLGRATLITPDKFEVIDLLKQADRDAALKASPIILVGMSPKLKVGTSSTVKFLQLVCKQTSRAVLLVDHYAMPSTWGYKLSPEDDVRHPQSALYKSEKCANVALLVSTCLVHLFRLSTLEQKEQEELTVWAISRKTAKLLGRKRFKRIIKMKGEMPHPARARYALKSKLFGVADEFVARWLKVLNGKGNRAGRSAGTDSQEITEKLAGFCQLTMTAEKMGERLADTLAFAPVATLGKLVHGLESSGGIIPASPMMKACDQATTMVVLLFKPDRYSVNSSVRKIFHHFEKSVALGKEISSLSTWVELHAQLKEVAKHIRNLARAQKALNVVVELPVARALFALQYGDENKTFNNRNGVHVLQPVRDMALWGSDFDIADTLAEALSFKIKLDGSTTETNVYAVMSTPALMFERYVDMGYPAVDGVMDALNFGVSRRTRRENTQEPALWPGMAVLSEVLCFNTKSVAWKGPQHYKLVQATDLAAAHAFSGIGPSLPQIAPLFRPGEKQDPRYSGRRCLVEAKVQFSMPQTLFDYGAVEDERRVAMRKIAFPVVEILRTKLGWRVGKASSKIRNVMDAMDPPASGFFYCPVVALTRDKSEAPTKSRDKVNALVVHGIARVKHCEKWWERLGRQITTMVTTATLTTVFCLKPEVRDDPVVKEVIEELLGGYAMVNVAGKLAFVESSKIARTETMPAASTGQAYAMVSPSVLSARLNANHGDKPFPPQVRFQAPLRDDLGLARELLEALCHLNLSPTTPSVPQSDLQTGLRTYRSAAGGWSIVAGRTSRLPCKSGLRTTKDVLWKAPGKTIIQVPRQNVAFAVKDGRLEVKVGQQQAEVISCDTWRNGKPANLEQIIGGAFQGPGEAGKTWSVVVDDNDDKMGTLRIAKYVLDDEDERLDSGHVLNSEGLLQGQPAQQPLCTLDAVIQKRTPAAPPKILDSSPLKDNPAIKRLLETRCGDFAAPVLTPKTGERSKVHGAFCPVAKGIMLPQTKSLLAQTGPAGDLQVLASVVEYYSAVVRVAFSGYGKIISAIKLHAGHLLGIAETTRKVLLDAQRAVATKQAEAGDAAVKKMLRTCFGNNMELLCALILGRFITGKEKKKFAQLAKALAALPAGAASSIAQLFGGDDDDDMPSWLQGGGDDQALRGRLLQFCAEQHPNIKPRTQATKKVASTQLVQRLAQQANPVPAATGSPESRSLRVQSLKRDDAGSCTVSVTIDHMEPFAFPCEMSSDQEFAALQILSLHQSSFKLCLSSSSQDVPWLAAAERAAEILLAWLEPEQTLGDTDLVEVLLPNGTLKTVKGGQPQDPVAEAQALYTQFVQVKILPAVKEGHPALPAAIVKDSLLQGVVANLGSLAAKGTVFKMPHDKVANAKQVEQLIFEGGFELHGYSLANKEEKISVCVENERVEKASDKRLIASGAHRFTGLALKTVHRTSTFPFFDIDVQDPGMAPAKSCTCKVVLSVKVRSDLSAVTVHSKGVSDVEAREMLQHISPTQPMSGPVTVLCTCRGGYTFTRGGGARTKNCQDLSKIGDHWVSVHGQEVPQDVVIEVDPHETIKGAKARIEQAQEAVRRAGDLVVGGGSASDTASHTATDTASPTAASKSKVTAIFKEMCKTKPEHMADFLKITMQGKSPRLWMRLGQELVGMADVARYHNRQDELNALCWMLNQLSAVSETCWRGKRARGLPAAKQAFESAVKAWARYGEAPFVGDPDDASLPKGLSSQIVRASPAGVSVAITRNMAKEDQPALARFCSSDPGYCMHNAVNIMATGHTLGVGKGAISFIDGKQRRKAKERRQPDQAQHKRRQPVKALHDVSNAVLLSFDVAFAPRLNVNDFDHARRSKRSSRQMYLAAHCRGHDELQARAARIGTTVVDASEFNSSKCCRKCKHPNQALGMSRMFRCVNPNCEDYRVPVARDGHGAANVGPDNLLRLAQATFESASSAMKQVARGAVERQRAAAVNGQIADDCKIT